MSRERLAELMQAQEDAVETDQEHSATHVSIFSMLRALARRAAKEPTHAALYRQAAAAIRQMQREEH
ncbi:MAG TPA: hypothetical protein VKT82_29065 [Ktedonobacterales bacterium]|nr:hypothetical protein [Ktedonobacterales bacterium]